jgi:hypothetical protein
MLQELKKKLLSHNMQFIGVYRSGATRAPMIQICSGEYACANVCILACGHQTLRILGAIQGQFSLEGIKMSVSYMEGLIDESKSKGLQSAKSPEGGAFPWPRGPNLAKCQQCHHSHMQTFHTLAAFTHSAMQVLVVLDQAVAYSAKTHAQHMHDRSHVCIQYCNLPQTCLRTIHANIRSKIFAAL